MLKLHVFVNQLPPIPQNLNINDVICNVWVRGNTVKVNQRGCFGKLVTLVCSISRDLN